MSNERLTQETCYVKCGESLSTYYEYAFRCLVYHQGPPRIAPCDGPHESEFHNPLLTRNRLYTCIYPVDHLYPIYCLTMPNLHCAALVARSIGNVHTLMVLSCGQELWLAHLLLTDPWSLETNFCWNHWSLIIGVAGMTGKTTRARMKKLRKKKKQKQTEGGNAGHRSCFLCDNQNVHAPLW